MYTGASRRRRGWQGWDGRRHGRRRRDKLRVNHRHVRQRDIDGQQRRVDPANRACRAAHLQPAIVEAAAQDGERVVLAQDADDARTFAGSPAGFGARRTRARGVAAGGGVGEDRSAAQPRVDLLSPASPAPKMRSQMDRRQMAVDQPVTDTTYRSQLPLTSSRTGCIPARCRAAARPRRRTRQMLDFRAVRVHHVDSKSPSRVGAKDDPLADGDHIDACRLLDRSVS